MTRSRSNGTLSLFDRNPAIFATVAPTLRPYQSRAIQELREHHRAGKRRILLVSPTGSGKTTIIASIIRTSSVPVLFLAHRMELIDQCAEEIRKVGITNYGIIRGDDERTNPNASVQIGSIQTLARRDKPPAGIVLIDEAHRAMSESYFKLIEEHYPHAIILGFTATPVRIDNRELGNLFQAMVIVTTYENLIGQGFLAAPWSFGAAQLDLSKIKISGSDFDEDQLGEIMSRPDLVGNMVQHWLAYANKYRTKEGGTVTGEYRRTFGFAVNIQHSTEIQSRFSAAGVRCAHIDGSTLDRRRRETLRALGDGDLDVVVSVGVLLEGIDVPSAKCAIFGRPTQSLVVHRQSGGRILRPWHPGCPKGCMAHPSVEPLILDHAGNIMRHGFPHEDLAWSLTEKPRPLAKRIATHICGGCYAYLPAHKRLCPYCGFESPPPPESDLPREKEEQLKQYVDSPEQMRRMFFDMIVQVARQKGYKPGFASARYKTRYGHWPPWEWSAAVKMQFPQDAEWQANFTKNAMRKEKAAAAKAAKELAKLEEKNRVEEIDEYDAEDF